MEKIDFSDIPELTPEIMCKANVRRNPYYEQLIKDGFSITIHYSAEDALEISKKIRNHKIKTDDLLELDEEELEALEEYKQLQHT